MQPLTDRIKELASQVLNTDDALESGNVIAPEHLKLHRHIFGVIPPQQRYGPEAVVRSLVVLSGQAFDRETSFLDAALEPEGEEAVEALRTQYFVTKTAVRLALIDYIPNSELLEMCEQLSSEIEDLQEEVNQHVADFRGQIDCNALDSRINGCIEQYGFVEDSELESVKETISDARDDLYSFRSDLRDLEETVSELEEWKTEVEDNMKGPSDDDITRVLKTNGLTRETVDLLISNVSAMDARLNKLGLDPTTDNKKLQETVAALEAIVRLHEKERVNLRRIGEHDDGLCTENSKMHRMVSTHAMDMNAVRDQLDKVTRDMDNMKSYFIAKAIDNQHVLPDEEKSQFTKEFINDVRTAIEEEKIEPDTSASDALFRVELVEHEIECIKDTLKGITSAIHAQSTQEALKQLEQKFLDRIDKQMTYYEDKLKHVTNTVDMVHASIADRFEELEEEVAALRNGDEDENSSSEVTITGVAIKQRGGNIYSIIVALSDGTEENFRLDDERVKLESIFS